MHHCLVVAFLGFQVGLYAAPDFTDEATCASHEEVSFTLEDADAWHLGSLNYSARKQLFTWSIGKDCYRGVESRKFPLGTTKIIVEHLTQSGHWLKLGALKVKIGNRITFQKYAFIAGEHDNTYEMFNRAPSRDVMKFEAQSDKKIAVYSKEPKIVDGVASLNLYDRGTEASSRNSILRVSPGNNDAVRIGFIPDRDHSLDYVPSKITPALAFASAIAIWKFVPKD